MKARRLYWQKARLHERYIMELSIYEMVDPVRYPHGIKYGLICSDLVSGKRVLMDNHHPKGPHVHLDEQELPYVFTDVSTLMKDFKKIVFEHLEVKI